jgi:hypothetical protein
MMDARKGLEPLAMPRAAWLAWLENASSMWSAMSIPATATARLQELLQINGRLTAERDALLAAAGTLDASRAKVAELPAAAARWQTAVAKPHGSGASTLSRPASRSPAVRQRDEPTLG